MEKKEKDFKEELIEEKDILKKQEAREKRELLEFAPKPPKEMKKPEPKSFKANKKIHHQHHHSRPLVNHVVFSAEKPKVKEVKEEEKLTLANERDIAMDFAMKAHQKFDRMIKASILFGSQVKDTSDSSSDIDIIFVIDDSSLSWDLELISWYREELG